MSSISHTAGAVGPGAKPLSATHPEPFLDFVHETIAAPRNGNESFRREFAALTHRLFLTPAAVGQRVIAFIGCDEMAGTGFVCTNVARELAFETTEPVCVLNASEQSVLFPRLLELNTGDSELEEALERPEAVRDLACDLGGNLWSLSSGSPQNQKLPPLIAPRFKGLVAQMRSDFRYALIAVPPLASDAASIPVCAAADAVVLVLGSATKRSAALEAVRLLRSLEINIAGAVLEKAEPPARR